MREVTNTYKGWFRVRLRTEHGAPYVKHMEIEARSIDVAIAKAQQQLHEQNYETGFGYCMSIVRYGSD